ALPADPATATGRYARRLPTLRGIGPVGAWVLATEIFGWRQIRNARQLRGLVGLGPAPYQSGETAHDQGITRAGNKHVPADGRARLDLAALPAHEGLVALVSTAVWSRESAPAPHRDCGGGAQTDHCSMAMCRARRDSRGCRAEKRGGMRRSARRGV